MLFCSAAKRRDEKLFGFSSSCNHYDKSRIREQAFQPVALSGLSFPTNDSPSEQAMRIVTNAATKVNARKKGWMVYFRISRQNRGGKRAQSAEAVFHHRLRQMLKFFPVLRGRIAGRLPKTLDEIVYRAEGQTLGYLPDAEIRCTQQHLGPLHLRIADVT